MASMLTLYGSQFAEPLIFGQPHAQHAQRPGRAQVEVHDERLLPLRARGRGVGPPLHKRRLVN